MLSLTFCVKRAILSYNEYIRLPVDTTVSEEKAEGVGWGESKSPKSSSKAKTLHLCKQFTVYEQVLYYTLQYTHILKYFIGNPASFSIGLKDKCRHLTSLLEFFSPLLHS